MEPLRRPQNFLTGSRLHRSIPACSPATPLEAIVAGPGGTANAQMFGWPEPYPDPEAKNPKLVVVDIEASQVNETLRMNAFAAVSQMALVGLPALALVFGALALVRRLRRTVTI